jgi:hypothetical protein
MTSSTTNNKRPIGTGVTAIQIRENLGWMKR